MSSRARRRKQSPLQTSKLAATTRKRRKNARAVPAEQRLISAQVVWNGVDFNRVLAPCWLVVAVATSLFVEPSVATRMIAVATLLLFPGAALLSYARIPFRNSAGRLVAAVALSVILLMGTSLVLSFLGPFLGVERPLDPSVANPVLVVCGALLVAVGGLRNSDAAAYLLRGVNVRGILTAVISFSLPLLALLGAERLDVGAPGDLAIAVTVATFLLLLAALVASLGGRRPPIATLLFSTVLATAYAVAARGTVLFGWDIHQEFAVALETINRGRWVIPADNDAYASMLSLTGLPALIGDVGRLNAAETFRYVFPVFSALTVVGVHEICRRVAPRGAALGAVLLLVVGSIALPRGMQAIARQETAFLLVAALAIFAFEPWLTIRTKRAVVLLAGFGIAVAHYSTSYAMAAMLLATALFGVILAIRRPELRRTRVFTPLVAALFTVVTLTWNVVLSGSISEVERLGNSIIDQGLVPLPRADEKGLLAAWLAGSEVNLVPVEDYREALMERVASDPYIEIDSTAATLQMTDAFPAQMTGLAPALAPAYEISFALVRQGILAFIVAAVITSLIVRYDNQQPFVTELGLLALAALGMAVVLRISGTIAPYYNPERGALHAAILYAPVVAIFIARLLRTRRTVRATILVALRASLTILLTGALSLSPQFVGGTPSAAHASFGEEYERLAVSRAEYATAIWLASRDDDPMEVATDRYGQIVLLSNPRGDIAVFPTIDPVGVRIEAYVYASRSNVVAGRARGVENGDFAIFEFPRDFYETTRATVYATEETRVFR